MKGAVKMRKRFSKLFAMFCIVICLVTGIGATTWAIDGYEGGYVGVEKGKQTVWNFITNFSYDQYYWAEDFMFRKSNNSYVDLMDFSFYCGHGNHWLISEPDGTIINLANAGNTGNSGWGDRYSRYVAFYSCKVVPCKLDLPADQSWYTPWTSVLTGVRQICGYRTDAMVANGPNIGSYFGARVRAGDNIWQRWLDANNLYGDLAVMRASAVYSSDATNDTYSSNSTPRAGYETVYITYQN
jgi:hypothetical protein